MNPHRCFVSILLLACAIAIAAYAQSSTGSISGAVTDPNGAVVPGARVEAKENATGRSHLTNTTEAGLYVFPGLPVGMYTISAEQAGFKKAVRTDIEVRLALRETIDLRLEVGEVQQTVEVRAEVPLLETTTPERGQNLSPQLLATLPIYAGGLRSAEAFLGYMPGVNSAGELSINGSGGRAREVMIDGASLTIPESGGTVFNFPGFEAFNEMKLVTSTYNAEYGRLGGGVELMVSKSGANDIHGAAFLNMRRDIFNAAGWTSNQVPGRTRGFRLKERFNEEGGAAGGPVWIPKLYNGRNKSFFYFTYVRDVRPVSLSPRPNATIPTVLMKQGIFTEVAPIFDPASTALVDGVNTRQPFAGNVIPKSRWSKVSTNVAPLIPDANLPGVTGNWAFINSSAHDDYIWTLKAEHAITPNHRVAFFLTRETFSDDLTDQFLGPLGNGLIQYQKPDNYRVNHDSVIRPTVLLHTTFGFTRQQQQWDNPQQKGFASKIGLPLTGKPDAFPVITFDTDALTGWGMNQGKVADGGQWARRERQLRDPRPQQVEPGRQWSSRRPDLCRRRGGPDRPEAALSDGFLQRRATRRLRLASV